MPGEGIPTNLYYRWSKDFLEAGKQRLVGDSERQADSRQVNEMWAEVEQVPWACSPGQASSWWRSCR